MPDLALRLNRNRMSIILPGSKHLSVTRQAGLEYRTVYRRWVRDERQNPLSERSLMLESQAKELSCRWNLLKKEERNYVG
uniref:Transposase n=1 Tax=Panagrellus redivivus TaxID=6233 RepID=A0A7E4VIN8_PANRE